MGDEATTTPGALDLDRLARAETVLAEVEDALAHLDAGTYGTCESCGEPVDAATLEARPTARRCSRHR